MGEADKKKVEVKATEKKVEVKAGDKKVEVKETKVEVKTAVYKVFVHCGQCARKIQTEFTEFQGVEEVKVDAGGGKVTVKGFGFDVEKLRKKVEKGCRKKVELIPPAPPKDDMVVDVKTKKEELKVITVKLPLHCPDCAVRVKEILLENKSIFEAKTDFGKNTCTVEGVLEEDKLVKYIFERTRKKGVVDKVDKKVIVKEEKVLVKKADKEKEKAAKEKEKEKEKAKEAVAKAVEKVKEVVAPYFIPCTHPHFVDYSHPWHRGCGGGGGGYCGGGYGYGGGGYGYGGGGGYGFSYTQSELKGYHDTAFLHCTHPNEFISEENPYACAVM